MLLEDLYGLTLPIYAHVSPYGMVRLAMMERLALDIQVAAG
jgi:hypothetical protein